MTSETVGALLAEAADTWPGAVGLQTPDGRTWTFAELRDAAADVAYALLELVEPGERIALWAPNCPEWFLLQLGAALAGVPVVTVNPAYQGAELQDVLARSRSSAIFVAPEFRGADLFDVLAQVRSDLPELREAVRLAGWDAFLEAGTPRRLPSVEAGDAAQIQYTSGTTGQPKGAVLPHGAIVRNGRAGAQRWAVEPGEVWLNAMPMFHVAGSVINSLGALASGATQLICSFDPVAVGALIASHRVSVACLAGTMWSMLLDRSAADLTSLRAAVAGGQSIPPELVRRVEATTGARMSILFGMTELCGTITAAALDDDDETRAETCGRPLPGVELRIEDGEVQVRGWLTMTGYFEDPGSTAATLIEDGWLRTGDMGSVDGAGRLRISGRIKEMIIRGAENIYPAEIEIRLREHPSIADAAVVGLPDPLYGETVAAALVLRPDRARPTDAELTDWCRMTLAPFKTPKAWAVVPALPITPSGKVRKFLVRDQVLAVQQSSRE